MPQSLSKVNIHCVFSTKNGIPLIYDPIRDNLHSYIVGTLANIKSYTHAIYANPDHIHVLCVLPRTITIASLISTIKTSSSKWIKNQGVANFSWQDGYGTFSVSQSRLEAVIKYIGNQKQHHKKTNFKEEFRKFLNEYAIEFDERYVWD